MRSLFVFLSLTHCFGLAWAFEVGGVSVTRTGLLDGRSDLISPTVVLEPGESVTVKWFLYREAMEGEMGPFTRQVFQQVDGSKNPRMQEATLENVSLARSSQSALLSYRLLDYGVPAARKWNAYFYLVEVTKAGDPTSIKIAFSSVFSLSEPAAYEAEANRLGVAIVTPAEELLPITLGSFAEPSREGVSKALDAGGIKKLLAKLDEEQNRKSLDRLRKLPGKLAAPKPENLSPIYYFTNRTPSGGYKQGEIWHRYFAFQAGRRDGYPASPTPYLGVATVHAPSADRRPGKLPQKSAIPFLTPSDFFHITEDYLPLKPPEIADRLWSKDVLVFLHGFNVSFENAILRAAQLKIDLQWPGEIVVLDWPSRGLTGAYWEDRKLVEGDPANHLTVSQFLNAVMNENRESNRLIERRGKRHLIAHSMGNEVFHRAVNHMGKLGMLKAAMFDQLIFAAPDIYIDDFRKTVSTLHALQAVRKMTLYYCQRDIAVNVSRVVNFLSLNSVLHPRNILEFLKGRAGITPQNYAGVDVINADKVNSSWTTILEDFYHGYYASSDMVLEDMKSLLSYEILDPTQRKATLSGPKQIGRVSNYIIEPALAHVSGK